MSLWTYHTKPKYLTATQQAAVTANANGWVYNRPDGTHEIMVAIPHLTDKQKPTISYATTDKTSYDIKTDTAIIFTLYYKFPITSTLTTLTILDFTIGLIPLQAAFTSAGSNTLVFTYTIPSTSGGKDAVLSTGSTVNMIGLTDIALHGAETVVLNNANYTGASTIPALFTLPASIQSTVKRTA